MDVAAPDPTYEHTPSVPVKWHPYADLFPWIEGKALDELVDDIRERGIVEPIVFLGDEVLDGRNRYMAARQLGIEYPRIEYKGDDPLGFVIAKNLKRRHLTDQQRAMVAGRIAKLPPGRPSQTRPDGAVTAKEASRIMEVPERSVVRAKTIQRDGSSELVEAVDRGEVSLASGADIASLPVEEQIAAIGQANPKALNAVVKRIRAEKQAEKKAKRVERERKLATKITALPDKKFGVIAADPEWLWESYSTETGMDRAAANHYPTSPTERIAQRDVPSIAADDCVLFLWATVPRMPDALRVMEAWGFAYKSHFIWLKDKAGTGYWNRNQHELLLVGTKGNPPAPAMGTQAASVIAAPVGRHSEKPEEFLELIEQHFPNLPKIELNRRGPARPNWSAWGLEAEYPHNDLPETSKSAQSLKSDLPAHDPETGEILEGADA